MTTAGLKQDDSGSPRWTEAQRAAIEHVAGDLLVSAAAGSGKTAVLAERCARLVTMDGPGRTTVDRLLVLTFTDAAANEMRGRIAAAIRGKIQGAEAQSRSATEGEGLARQLALVERASISTLHAFCGRVLRAYFHEAGVDPAFEIMDEDEGGLLRDEVISEAIARRHGLPEGSPAAAAFLELYEGYAQGRDGTLAEFVRRLQDMLESLKDPAAWVAAARQVYSPAGVQDTCETYARTVADELQRLAERSARMARAARRAGAPILADPMEGFAATIRGAAADLSKRGMAAWENAARAIRSFTWPERIFTMKELDNFAALKERSVVTAKDQHKKLLRQTFAYRQTSERITADLRSCARPLDTLLELTLECQEQYAAAKRAQNQLDFADLERLTLELLTKAGSTAAADLKQRYEHILVDEFQDINPLQAALLEAVRDGAKHDGKGNLFVVGDVKQSIYGFRLAEPRLFMELERKSRAVATHKAFVALQNNFRSLPGLLDAMNGVFARLLTPEVAGITYKDGHELRPAPGEVAMTAPEEGRIELDVVVTDAREEEDEPETGAADRAGGTDRGESHEPAEGGTSEHSAAELSATEHEALFVARRIAALMAEGVTVRNKDGTTRPLKYRDIAILLRGVRNRAPIFVRAMDRHGIPVHADLATGYFDAEEVRQTLALLNVVDNPLQDVPLATVMLSPYGRFSVDDLARVRLAYRDRETMFHQAVLRFAAERAEEAAEAGNVELETQEAELAARLRAFLARVDRYRARVRVLPLPEALAEIYQDARMLVYAAGLEGSAQRVANLQALHQRAQQFSGFRRQGLYRFLRFIERLREAEGDFGEAPVLSEASDVVRIMTIHKSKGLEFPVVFVSGLGAKFNTDRGGPVVVSRDLHVGLQAADVERNVYVPTAASAAIAATARKAERAEELRLLYVAMTRARERLVLTGAMKLAAYDRVMGDTAGGGTAGAGGTTVAGLPADVLLKAGSFLECLLPVAAGDAGARALQVVRHGVEEEPTNHQLPTADATATATAMETGTTKAGSADLAGVIARITGKYAHDNVTKMPALYSVTELKKMAAGEEPAGRGADDPGEDQAAPLVLDEGPGAESGLIEPAFGHAGGGGAEEVEEEGRLDGRRRGTVTHRVLEEMDFAAVVDRRTLSDHIESMKARRRLTKEEEEIVNRGMLEWFIGTPLAKRLRDLVQAAGGGTGGSAVRRVPEAASFGELPLFGAVETSSGAGSEAAGGRMIGQWGGVQVLRELPFVYALPLDEVPGLVMAGADIRMPSAAGTPDDRADWPQLRGTIDLLVIDPALGSAGKPGAEIVDYKTDAQRHVAERLPAYERQMHLYARAVEEALHVPVVRATLVFLAARTCTVLEHPAARR